MAFFDGTVQFVFALVINLKDWFSCVAGKVSMVGVYLVENHMSRVMRKSNKVVSKQVRQTKLYKHRRWLEAGNFRFRKKRKCTIRVAKTKVLISYAV